MDFQDLTIYSHTRISEAISTLEKCHLQILLVVDDHNQFIGVVTDSDIRRAIIRGIDLAKQVSEILNSNPVFLPENTSERDIYKTMRESRRHQIPIIRSDKTIVGIRFLDEFLNPKLNCIGFVLAGGEGKRMQPLSFDTPKPLLKVGQQEMIVTLLNEMFGSGIQKIHVALRYKKELIQEKLDSIPEFQGKIEYIIEDKPLGTAGALSFLSEETKPIVVANADLVSDIDFGNLLSFHNSEKNDVTLAVKKQIYQIPFGISKLKGSKVVSLQEKPKLNYFVNIGFYVLEPSLLNLLEVNKKMDMPNFINILIHNKNKVGAFPLHEAWQDIANPQELRKANQALLDSR